MYIRKLGFTLISVLIALFILAGGIIVLVRVYPLIMELSEKSKNSVNISFIADKIFAEIEEKYSKKEVSLPETIENIIPEYPDYKYKVNFFQEKEDLYRVELEIFWKKEGKIDKKYFVSILRRR